MIKVILLVLLVIYLLGIIPAGVFIYRLLDDTVYNGSYVVWIVVPLVALLWPLVLLWYIGYLCLGNYF